MLQKQPQMNTRNSSIELLRMLAMIMIIFHHTRPFLWQNVFHNAQYQESLILIPYSILAVVCVYTVCSLIDLLRQQIIEKPFMGIVRRYSDKGIIPFKKAVVFLKNLVFGN